MPAEPLVPVFVKLPASMVADLSAAFSALSGFPDPHRAAAVKAAVGAYIIQARQSGAIRSPEPPVPRQRSRVLPVPSQPIARRATAG